MDDEPVRIPVTDVLDLHTIPPRDVLPVVEEYLYEARRLGFRFLRIIHGRGIGAQRETVRSVLKRTDFVETFSDAPMEAGGWGATIVRLRAQAGLEREGLLEKIRVRILGFATYLGCGNDAEDIAQQTMLVLHGRYAGVADPGELLKLATRICTNLALNWRRHKMNSALAGEASEARADSGSLNPESAVARKELQELLLKAIRKSDERCREMLRLRLSGASSKEIAASLGISAGAVDTAYFRCLQRLRNAMGGTR